MKLTPQQERFAQEFASGKSQADSYRIAYPRSSKWQASSVYEAASKLAAKIAPRLDELRDQLAEKALWSREQSVKVLAEVARRAEKDADRVRAVAELNRMHGYEAATTIVHKGPNGPIEHEHRHAMTDEQLEAIAAGSRG